MPLKMVALQPNVYNMLVALKSKGESFSDLIRELVLSKRPEMARMPFTSQEPRAERGVQPKQREARRKYRREYMRRYRDRKAAEKLFD